MPAIVPGERATGVEFTTRGTCEQARHLTAQLETLRRRIGIRLGVGRKQRPRVRVSCVSEDLLGRALLYFVVLLAAVFIGGGRFSLDTLVRVPSGGGRR